MTRGEIITVLAAITRHLDSRVEVWRTVVDANGTVVKRMYRGSYVDTHRGSRIELHSEGETS